MKPHIKEKLKKINSSTLILQLQNGRIKNLPTELFSCENLKQLDLFKNNIDKLPDWFYKLSSLEIFSLNSNKFTEIPSLIFLVKNLRSFSIRDNKIKEIQKNHLQELFKIEKIDLAFNQIVSIPEVENEIFVTDLNLSGNQLTKFPNFLSNAKNLKNLNLSNNQISFFDDNAFEGLINLEKLDLSGNKITFLPSSINKLKRLKSLNISSNNLSFLPKELEELENLEEIQIRSNNLDKVPLEIEAQGVQAIINYYLSLGDNVKLFEAKLLIVGQGSVGKTYLMNRLLKENTPETVTTEGIEINSWNVQTESTENFRINVWDFGGQEIYHSTHQFFLTKRSLYLLVWDARTDQHLTSFDYWLNVIRLLSNESPVIMVMNKCDERTLNIDERSLKEKFKNVKNFFQVSALTGKNIQNLKVEISKLINELPLIGDNLPRVWVEIRNELESLHENFITREIYLEICNRHGLDNKKALFLSQYFHDLGVFLHFQESFLLKNLVFLKPEWATNAVYKILDSRNIIQNFGEFHFNELDEILNDYPKDKFPYLIELMKKFELCFELPSNRFLIPELLQPEKSQFQWDYSDNLKFEYHYDFMPAGILPRYIVRARDLIFNKTFWKNGVVIEREGTHGLIISDQFSRKIQIWINGSERAILLEIIRNDLNSINNTLNYDDVPEKIPCNCHICISSDHPHLFNFTFIKEISKNNQFKTVPCEKSFLGVNVENLIGHYSISNIKQDIDAIYNSENLVFDLYEFSTRLLERKYSYNGRPEDEINDFVTDMLRSKGYQITDQTRSGISFSENGSGEVDIMVRNKNGLPISIIECFKIYSCGPENREIEEHVKKLILNYNTNRLNKLFLIIYSYAKKFDSSWEQYSKYIENLNSKESIETNAPLIRFVQKNDLGVSTNVKVGVGSHKIEGEEIEVYHFFINMKT
ncbi:GTP-binding protein [Lacihabitans sp. CCS-44]|nr:GTP-binding protein [Lacihabitans sp. CCS-44]